MFKFTAKIDMFFLKFFAQNDAEAIYSACAANCKKVLFVDTPSTVYLFDCISRLEAAGVECIVRDHHGVVGPQNKREEEIAAANRDVENAASDTFICTRAEAPACVDLLMPGEFRHEAEGQFAIVADPDADGLLAALYAVGLTWAGMENDAAVLDGPRSGQIEANLTPNGWLLARANATLPVWDPTRPEAFEKAQKEVFEHFAGHLAGFVHDTEWLENKTAEYEEAVGESQKIAAGVREIRSGVVIVSAVGSKKYDIGALMNAIEKPGVKVTVTEKPDGPIGKLFGKQFSIVLTKEAQKVGLNVTSLLPKDFVSSPEKGVVCNVSFMAHVSEEIWKSHVLPAILAATL